MTIEEQIFNVVQTHGAVSSLALNHILNEQKCPKRKYSLLVGVRRLRDKGCLESVGRVRQHRVYQIKAPLAEPFKAKFITLGYLSRCEGHKIKQIETLTVSLHKGLSVDHPKS